jgi:hypothetical protein
MLQMMVSVHPVRIDHNLHSNHPVQLFHCKDFTPNLSDNISQLFWNCQLHYWDQLSDRVWKEI